MTGTTDVQRFEPWEVPAAYRHDMWVRATDYDALAAKLEAAERRERQLLDTTATCRTLRRELNTAKATSSRDLTGVLSRCAMTATKGQTDTTLQSAHGSPSTGRISCCWIRSQK